MATGNKTQPTGGSVAEFIAAIEPEDRRADARALDKLLRRVTGAKPALWGPSIVGYGRTHYRYESGREGEWFEAGFSPRKANLTLYLMSGFGGFDALLDRLGKFTTGKSCLYVKRLTDIDLAVLEELAARSVAHLRSATPGG